METSKPNMPEVPVEPRIFASMTYPKITLGRQLSAGIAEARSALKAAEGGS